LKNGRRVYLFDVEKTNAAWEATEPLADGYDRRGVPRLRRGRPPAAGSIPHGLAKFPLASPDGEDGHNDHGGGDDDGGKVDDRVTLLKATAEHKAAQAKLAVLKLQEKEKSLISVEQVKKDGAELGTILLGHIQAFPARLAPQLASMKEADEFKFNRVLTVAMNDLIISIRAKLGLP
jgi:hypothetical protein